MAIVTDPPDFTPDFLGSDFVHDEANPLDPEISDITMNIPVGWIMRIVDYVDCMGYVGTPLPYLEEYVSKFLVVLIFPCARIFVPPDFQLITFL